MHRQIFVTLARPGASLARTLMLLASLREFGGSLADLPVWVLYPRSWGDFNEGAGARLAAYSAEPVPFEIEEVALSFPFSAKVRAAAFAEERAAGRTELLTWLDGDTLVLSEPGEFMLPGEVSLGYRPVHHRLLGVPWGEEPDSFWKLIYRHCQVPAGVDFAMVTHVGETIRPYFNAGAFVVRPGRGLLAAWWNAYQSCQRASAFQSFYERDRRYAIFMHQAVFTGTLLRMLERKEMQELSSAINYPLHLHEQIPPDLRAKHMHDLVTVRYEELFDEPGWGSKLPLSEELVGWIETQLDRCRSIGDSA
jgi:hypothetical protein